jgi:plastocyanin
MGVKTVVLGGAFFFVVLVGVLYYKSTLSYGQSIPSTTTTPTSRPIAKATKNTTQEFTVNGSNFKFDPQEIIVKKGDTVKVTFKNTGGMHDFVIDEFNVKTKKLATGEQESVQFVADKTGSFEYYCSVGQHRTMGMWGTLKVE